MRETKIRFWNPSLERMFYGEEYWDEDHWYYVTGEGEVGVAEADLTDTADSEVVPLFAIGQLDKKGKAIYEGDWLLALVGDYGSHFYCIVFYDETTASFRVHGFHGVAGDLGSRPWIDVKECEVVGNAYEHETLKDLLKGGK